MQPITLVTVVFEAELPLLGLQARSLSRFVADAVFAEIIVIDNTRSGLTRGQRGRLLDEYGRWGSKVVWLRPDDICALPASRGWISQQVLKLMVFAHVHTDFFLILDAKNHWLRPTDVQTFLNPDGRARGGCHGYRGHPLEATLIRVLDYLGVDPEPWLDGFPPTHTPFVMSTALVERMTIEIAEHSGRPFADEFVRADLTEFFCYSGWLIATFGGLDEHLDQTVITSANVWPGRSGAADFARTIAAAETEDAPFLSVHRTALAKAGWAASNRLAEFWTDRGLFAGRRAALAFIAAFKLSYLARMSIRKARTLRGRRRRSVGRDSAETTQLSR